MYQGGSSRVCATLLGDTFRLNIRNTTLTPLDLGWNALGPEMGEAGAGRELCGSRPVRPFLKTGKTLTSLGLWGNVAVMWPSEDEEEGEDEQEKQEVTERDAMANKRRRH